MTIETPLPRMASWELLVVWITVGAFLGTLGGLAFGAVRLGVGIGVGCTLVLGVVLETLQRWKESR
ncbi:hypothetical protein LCGC14_1496190 [marine sediment metagenome]|uniref:Uncharacterized protein n=1 Tax=marine sediment metagenome TaxID=412755 RepID=A0A0F9LKZ9_9ZZZZ